MGITDRKVVGQVAPGVYALRGWGIAHSYAIDAPKGWIIVDTGDSTQAAAEMREMLERALGSKISVAAILLTHWQIGSSARVRRRSAVNHWPSWIERWIEAGSCHRREPPRRCPMPRAS